MIRLSVIMPVYNGKKYIENTIPALLDNTYEDIEIIAVDDGSTDDSYDFLKTISSVDKRLKVIVEENRGIATARNQGIHMACGEYLAFADQDDILEIDRLHSILEDIDGVDILFFSTIKDYGDRVEPCDVVDEQRIITGKKDTFENLIWPMVYPTASKCISYLGHVWQGIYRRNLIIKNNIEFKRFVSIEDDFVFVLGALCNAINVMLVPEEIYHWVIHYDSTTYSTKYIDGFIDRCEEFYSYCDDLLIKCPDYSGEYRQKFVKMSKQVTAVRIVINEGSSSSVCNSRRILSKYIQTERYYLTGTYLGKGASRKSAELIYFLLKIRCNMGALIFQKIVNFYHVVKRNDARI